MALGGSAACGAIQPATDAGTEDATVDVVDASPFFDVTLPDTLDDRAQPAEGGEAQAGDADAEADSDAGVFNAIPDASGCVYIDDSGYGCTNLAKPTPVNVGCVSAAPTPEGGTIVPGLYYLTKADYNAQWFDGSCPTGSTWAGAMEFCGNIIEWYDINDVHSDFIGNLVYRTSGTELETNQYCPSGPYYGAFGYTSANGQLVINYGTSTEVLLVETFTKQ